jgi:hypothetical protein
MDFLSERITLLKSFCVKSRLEAIVQLFTALT